MESSRHRRIIDERIEDLLRYRRQQGLEPEPLIEQLGSLDPLPEEIILTICRDLDNSDLNRLAQVSKKAYRICSDELKVRKYNRELEKERERARRESEAIAYGKQLSHLGHLTI